MLPSIALSTTAINPARVLSTPTRSRKELFFSEVLSSGSFRASSKDCGHEGALTPLSPGCDSGIKKNPSTKEMAEATTGKVMHRRYGYCRMSSVSRTSYFSAGLDSRPPTMGATTCARAKGMINRLMPLATVCVSHTSAMYVRAMELFAPKKPCNIRSPRAILNDGATKTPNRQSFGTNSPNISTGLRPIRSDSAPKRGPPIIAPRKG
mmetsp:Transcript_48321/g.81328  ORF Transcript_48321/g.81328 Transcript_48321/m.81328 type:complete len:208 (-) Transcript_48321:204-827(-)